MRCYHGLFLCSQFQLRTGSVSLGNGSGKVFTWFSAFSSTDGLVVWFGIGVTYLRLYKGLKAQGIDRKTLPFAPRV